MHEVPPLLGLDIGIVLMHFGTSSLRKAPLPFPPSLCGGQSPLADIPICVRGTRALCSLILLAASALYWGEDVYVTNQPSAGSADLWLPPPQPSVLPPEDAEFVVSGFKGKRLSVKWKFLTRTDASRM